MYIDYCPVSEVARADDLKLRLEEVMGEEHGSDQ